MGSSKYSYLKDLPLTEKQQRVLDYIIEEKGNELSVDKIAKDLGYSESAHIGGIIKKFLRIGYLTKKGKNKDTKYINENE